MRRGNSAHAYLSVSTQEFHRANYFSIFSVDLLGALGVGSETMPRMHTTGRSLRPHQIREVAVVAERCEKTVEAYLDGKPVLSTTQCAIERALVQLGWGAVVRPTRAGSVAA